MADQFENLTREQLLKLVRQRERQKKLGLVWERDAIERDKALDDRFVSLSFVPELRDGDGPWPNMVVEGDNFDALRWLRMTMAGQFRCILIDPPYNTGNKDWVYNDHYIDKEDAWRHSTWLEFLYQRLTIARDLLARDGVLMVTISDEQRAKLEMLMDEVLPGQRIGSMVWRTKDTGNDAGKKFSQVHEHVLIYAGERFRFRGRPVSDSKFRNPDKDARGDWSPQPLTKAHSYLKRAQTYYPIQDPKTKYWYPCDPESVWRFATKDRIKPGQKLRSPTMEEWIDNGEIYFPPCEETETYFYNTLDELLRSIEDKQGPRLPKKRTPLLRADLPDLAFWVGKRIAPGRPSRKDFLNTRPLSERTAPISSWIAGLNEQLEEDELYSSEFLRSPRGGVGGEELVEIMGKKVFDNPKPVALFRELIRQPTDCGDLVLDFFAGSATTAQAVMELNAEGGAARRFVMVSSTEATEDDLTRNVCRDVTAGRIRQLNLLKEGTYADLMAPFAYLRTHELAFEDIDYALPVEEAWHALEASHGLPLTRWDASSCWAEHAGDGVVLVMVERVTAEALTAIERHAAARANLFAYAFAPGQLRTAIEGLDVEVHGVREALVRRFVP